MALGACNGRRSCFSGGFCFHAGRIDCFGRRRFGIPSCFGVDIRLQTVSSDDYRACHHRCAVLRAVSRNRKNRQSFWCFGYYLVLIPCDNRHLLNRKRLVAFQGIEPCIRGPIRIQRRQQSRNCHFGFAVPVRYRSRGSVFRHGARRARKHLHDMAFHQDFPDAELFRSGSLDASQPRKS